jgi:hypothetical protein
MRAPATTAASRRPQDAPVKYPYHFRVSAQTAGRSIFGKVVPVQSNQKDLSGTKTVTLRFNGRDIRRERVDGPYVVTNVYLLDLGISGLPAGIADDVWKTIDDTLNARLNGLYTGTE